MARFRIKRKIYANMSGNIIGYTGSMPIYDNTPGVGRISSSTVANTAEYQKQQLQLMKQREKIEHEREMEMLKMERQRQKQQEELTKEQQKQSIENQKLQQNSNMNTTPNPKLLEIGPKPIPAIPMGK
jgi:alanyl-tRNA synthetase